MGSTATLPEQEEAEAANAPERLFQYSEWVHVGTGAAECEQRENGKCQDVDHFHAWVCLPNALQHRDIQEKSRAAKARKQRAMKDKGTDTRPASDSYEMLEAELDELMDGPRRPVARRLAEGKVREQMQEMVRDVVEDDPRFENYYQDSEEWRRLEAMDEEKRPVEEWATLDRTMTEFGNAVEKRAEAVREEEIARLESAGEETVREVLRKQRIETEGGIASIHTYYVWLGYICTHPSRISTRTFKSLEAYKEAAPEVIEAIDKTLQDLETRTIRGEAAGNS